MLLNSKLIELIKIVDISRSWSEAKAIVQDAEHGKEKGYLVITIAMCDKPFLKRNKNL